MSVYRPPQVRGRGRAKPREGDSPYQTGDRSEYDEPFSSSDGGSRRKKPPEVESLSSYEERGSIRCDREYEGAVKMIQNEGRGGRGCIASNTTTSQQSEQNSSRPSTHKQTQRPRPRRPDVQVYVPRGRRSQGSSKTTTRPERSPEVRHSPHIHLGSENLPVESAAMDNRPSLPLNSPWTSQNIPSQGSEPCRRNTNSPYCSPSTSTQSHHETTISHDKNVEMVGTTFSQGSHSRAYNDNAAASEYADIVYTRTVSSNYESSTEPSLSLDEKYSNKEVYSGSQCNAGDDPRADNTYCFKAHQSHELADMSGSDTNLPSLHTLDNVLGPSTDLINYDQHPSTTMDSLGDSTCQRILKDNIPNCDNKSPLSAEEEMQTYIVSNNLNLLTKCANTTCVVSSAITEHETSDIDKGVKVGSNLVDSASINSSNVPIFEENAIVKSEIEENEMISDEAKERIGKFKENVNDSCSSVSLEKVVKPYDTNEDEFSNEEDQPEVGSNNGGEKPEHKDEQNREVFPGVVCYESKTINMDEIYYSDSDVVSETDFQKKGVCNNNRESRREDLETMTEPRALRESRRENTATEDGAMDLDEIVAEQTNKHHADDTRDADVMEEQQDITETRDASDEREKQPALESNGQGAVYTRADQQQLSSICDDEISTTSFVADIPTQSTAGDSEEEEVEAADGDSWDAMFDDDGECLDPAAMQELTNKVGKVKIQKTTKIDYLTYQPKDKAEIDFSSYGHVIEIYDFPDSFVTVDLITAFQSYMSRGFDLKWVDDTHALGIFDSPIAAQDALSMVHPLLKVCSLQNASKQSKAKARRCVEFLQPYKERPKTSASAARRLVAGALGIQANVPRETREKERKLLKEAKARKRQDRKTKEDIWEFGRCAMDEES